MKLIVGLGNPGIQYETTRHNVGFLAIDRMIDVWKAQGPTVKNQGEVYTATIGSEKVLLLKPKTFMNLSGRCVAPFFNFYQCTAQDLIVLHDDLDLPSMALRLKEGGGTGGHNGLKSIDESLGKDHRGYYRVRLGIGRPADHPETARMSPADYVLQPFSDYELGQLDPVLEDTIRAVELILEGNIRKAMNQFHRTKE